MTLTIHRDGGRIVARGDGQNLATLSRSPHGVRVAWYNLAHESKDLERAIIEAFDTWEKTT